MRDSERFVVVIMRRFPVHRWLSLSGGWCAGGGEVGGAKRGAPHPVEVVLGPAQVQGERVLQQAEAGQRFLQAVDGAGGGLEHRCR